jgi:thioredoxin-related protein
MRLARAAGTARLAPAAADGYRAGMWIEERVVFAAALWSCCGFATGQELPAGFVAVPVAEARAQARAQDRVLLLDFSTPACEPCRRLAETWADPKVREWIAAHAVAVRVDPEVERAIAAEHRVDAYPTVVFLAADGAEIGRILGHVDAAGMLRRVGELGDAQSKDFKVRQGLAAALREKGDHAGALEHYLWCWDEGVKHNPSFVGVRSSFFLRELAEFARDYAPAREALEARRDAVEARVVAGDVSLPAVSDMTRLNEHLGTPERSLAAFEKVPAGKWRREPISRRVLFDAVLEILHEAKRYGDILKLMGEPERALDQELASLGFPGLPEQLRAHQRDAIVAKFACVVEAYYGTSEDAAAAALGERLLSVRAGSATWVALIEAARRAGKDVASHDLAVRALRELPEDEQAAVRRALRAK